MPRQAGEEMRGRILQAITELSAQNSRPPTNREIGLFLGGKSTGHIDYHLRLMREQGVIQHEPRKSRGIMLLEQQAPRGPVRIPLAGQIAAGLPIEASNVPDEYVDLTEGMSFDGDVYALRVKGESMIDDHIDDGDVVIVRRQDHARDGETVVALLNSDTSERGEATLKRYYRDKNRIRLEPRNRTMLPFFVDEGNLKIQGKVIAVLRQV